MPVEENPIDRAWLDFPEAVRGAFGFLKKLGFRCVHTGTTLKRYESDQVFANIYHGRSSYELGVEIGLLGSSEEQGYSVSELIRLADPEQAATYRNFVALTPESVETGVNRLSDTVQRFAPSALRGDPAVFSKLRKQRKEWAKTFEMEVLARQVRPKAEAAFRNKDYEQAARLYESIRSQLTSAELKKLDYAHKHK